MTACIRVRPTRRFCAAGSTVIGPMPATGELRSTKLLPTMFPASSATTPENPGLVSRIVARPVATSGEGKGRENPVPIGDVSKGGVYNAPAFGCVGRARRTDGEFHWML